MIVNINLELLRSALKDLEQEKLTRANRSFMIRLLRELADATEKTPQMEGESHSIIKVKIQDAMDQRRLQTLDQQIAEQERMRAAGATETARKNLNQALLTILDETLLKIDSIYDSYIFLYEAGRLTFGAARAVSEAEAEAHKNPRPHGLTYTVARLGQPMIIPDMSAHPLFAGMEWTGTIIGIPLKVGPRIIGVMTTCRKPVQEFSPEEIHVLQALADQAALEIENARIFNLAREQVRIDASTGLHNRRALDEHLQSEILHSSEEKNPFALFMMNVDGIQDVSSRYGRPAADFLMAGIATAAAQGLRKTDFLARYDDSRWSLVVSRADRDTAATVAERIQEAVTRKPFSLPDRGMKKVSLSMGIAIFPLHGANAERLIEAADEALRHGQAGGPSAVQFAGAPPE